jgi:ferredoxin
VRLTIDEHLCSGQGRCYLRAPELLEGDEEGFVSIRGRTIEVPPGLEGAARRAVNACPEDAISIDEP